MARQPKNPFHPGEILLEEFLEPFTEKFTAALKENEHADFYYICCRILAGYLDLEKGLVVSA